MRDLSDRRLPAGWHNHHPTKGGTNLDDRGKVLHGIQGAWIRSRLKRPHFKSRPWYEQLFERCTDSTVPVKLAEAIAKDLQIYYIDLVPVLKVKRVTTAWWKDVRTGQSKTAGFNDAIIDPWWLKKHGDKL